MLKTATSSLILITSVFLTTTMLAQEETADAPKVYRDYTQAELEEESQDLMHFLNDVLVVNVESGEETLDRFVQLLQEQSPIHLNIIVMEDAKDIKIPPVKLNNVSAGAVINAITTATNNLVTFDYDETGQIGFVGRTQGFVTANQVSVINLSQVLSTYSNESFLSAVEIGMEMMGNKNSSIQMKLHEETSTLFLRGSNEEIHLIEQIVDKISNRQDAMQALLRGMGSGGGFGQGGPSSGGGGGFGGGGFGGANSQGGFGSSGGGGRGPARSGGGSGSGSTIRSKAKTATGGGKN